ncbi:CLUMA_CG005758, isoform A, partial [Clunio marinus]
MVFVHGESYEWNSGNPYDGSILASYGQVLVVTINYRLGILGFLNANVDRFSKSPANYGLMDVLAALHWIQENIEAFGGDSRSVTLAGHSTGAACVHFLIASQAVPDGLLFHRAILMSGSGLAPWSLVGDPAHYAAIVAHHVNCSVDLPHQALMKCLREVPIKTLLSTPIRPSEFGNTFGPSVDGVVIDTGDYSNQQDQYDFGTLSGSDTKRQMHYQNNLNVINSVLLRKLAINKLSRYDLLVGVTRAESYFVFNSGDVQYGIEGDRRSKILRTYVRSTYSYHLNEILATVVNEYTDWERPVQHPINIRDETLEALSDAQVVAPAALTVDLHSADHRNSFLYVFDYQTKFGDYPQRQGCIHGEDLPYFFGAPLVGGFNHFPKNYTKAEISLSEVVMLYWSNFIRTGNPNEQQDNRDRGKSKNIEWTPYESVHKKYLNLDLKPKLKNHYRAHRLSFWLNLIPDLHKPGNDDVPLSHHELENDDGTQEKSTVKPLTPQRDKFNLTIANGTMYSTSLLFNYTSSLRSNRNISSNTARTKNQVPVQSIDHDLYDENATSNPPSEDGFAAYSTALSVTIAIGCSLLILNVLIFAGVYYQRDKTRLNEPRTMKKRTENGQMPNNICGDLETLTIHAKSDPTTILGHHHSMHQLPPPEFADLPQRIPPAPKHLKS